MSCFWSSGQDQFELQPTFSAAVASESRSDDVLKVWKEMLLSIESGSVLETGGNSFKSSVGNV